MTPAAPFVGAVTTRWPAAFSSLTARAKRFTQSIARIGSATVDTQARAPWERSPSAGDAPEEAPASSDEEEGIPVRRSASWPASARARRGTSRPPGRMPAADVPASTQSNIVSAMRSR